MSTVICNIYLIRKVNIEEYLIKHKSEIEDRLRNENALLNRSQRDFILENSTMSTGSLMNKVGQIRSIEISLRVINLNLRSQHDEKEYLAVIDTYGILKPLHLYDLSVHTGADGWVEDYQKVIDAIKPQIGENTITSPDELFSLVDENVFNMPKMKIIIGELFGYSFLKCGVVENMVINAIERDVLYLSKSLESKTIITGGN